MREPGRESRGKKRARAGGVKRGKRLPPSPASGAASAADRRSPASNFRHARQIPPGKSCRARRAAASDNHFCAGTLALARRLLRRPLALGAAHGAAQAPSSGQGTRMPAASSSPASSPLLAPQTAPLAGSSAMPAGCGTARKVSPFQSALAGALRVAEPPGAGAIDASPSPVAVPASGASAAPPAGIEGEDAVPIKTAATKLTSREMASTPSPSTLSPGAPDAVASARPTVALPVMAAPLSSSTSTAPGSEGPTSRKNKAALEVSAATGTSAAAQTTSITPPAALLAFSGWTANIPAASTAPAPQSPASENTTPSAPMAGTFPSTALHTAAGPGIPATTAATATAITASEPASPAAPAPQSPSPSPLLPALSPTAAGAGSSAGSFIGTSQGTAATATNPQAARSSPAAQLAPALFSLVRSGTSTVLTLRLEPASLGQVQVEITRSPAGPASVKVTAEQSETLLLLVRDQPALQQALGRAGLTLDPQSVSFHLAPSQPPSQPAAAPVGSSQGANTSLANSGGNSTGTGAGPAAGGAQTGSASSGGAGSRRSRSARTAARTADASTVLSVGARATRAWLHAGLDITA